jgi:hypothetical protein
MLVARLHQSQPFCTVPEQPEYLQLSQQQHSVEAVLDSTFVDFCTALTGARSSSCHLSIANSSPAVAGYTQAAARRPPAEQLAQLPAQCRGRGPIAWWGGD